jgi:DNA-binding NtrC family response regulator
MFVFFSEAFSEPEISFIATAFYFESPISRLTFKTMQIRTRLEKLIDEMLDGQILLDEARDEFEKIYIEKALERNRNHLSNTAIALGIHRNTLSKRVSAYQTSQIASKTPRRLLNRRSR